MPELDAMFHCALFCAVPLLLKHQPETSVTEQVCDVGEMVNGPGVL